MKYVLYFMLSILPLLSPAQTKPDPDAEKWSQGSIALNDGKELKGLILYEDRTGILAFKDEAGTQSFTARTAAAFEYFDKIANTQRIFYALPFNDPLYKNRVRPQFFEMLRELPGFTVLSKADPITTQGQHGIGNPGQPVMHYTEFAQTETVYIMDAKNEIHPYLQGKTKRPDAESLENNDTGDQRKKIIDKDLLTSFVTEPVYNKLKHYAKEQRLSFKRKDDLLKILDHYKTMLN